MVKLTKIYTRGGDTGDTSLGNGDRVPKHDPRVEAYGSVDEVNSAIGLARLYASEIADDILRRIQNDLFDLGADLCTPVQEDERQSLRITQSQVDWLEHTIDGLNAELQPLNSFVLPGGSSASAFLHLARTVTRRAEREIVRLGGKEELGNLPVQYINRLSDLLFVLARSENQGGLADVLWVPGAGR